MGNTVSLVDENSFRKTGLRRSARYSSNCISLSSYEYSGDELVDGLQHQHQNNQQQLQQNQQQTLRQHQQLKPINEGKVWL